MLMRGAPRPAHMGLLEVASNAKSVGTANSTAADIHGRAFHSARAGFGSALIAAIARASRIAPRYASRHGSIPPPRGTGPNAAPDVLHPGEGEIIGDNRMRRSVRRWTLAAVTLAMVSVPGIAALSAEEQP